MRWKLAIASFLLAAAAAAADHPLSTLPVGPTWRTCNLAAAAPLGNAFVAVWTEGTYSSSFQLRAMRVDSSGKPLDPVSFRIATTSGASFFLTGMDGDAVVAWLSGYGGSAGVPLWSFARIDAAGVVTPLPTPVAQVAAVAASGGNILAVTANGSTLSLTLLDRDGAIVRANVPIAYGAQQIGSVDVSAVADGFLIVYTDAADGRVRVFHAATSAIRGGTVAPVVDSVTTYQAAFGVRLAVNHDHALALWNEAGDRTRVRLLSSDGTPTAAAPADLGNFAAASSIIPFGDGFLATLFERLPDNSYDLVVARLTVNGDIVSAVRTKAQGLYLAAGIAASGPAAIVVWVSPAIGSPTETLAAPVVDPIAPAIVSLAPAGNQHVHGLFATASGAVAVWSEAGPVERVVIGRLDAAGAPVDGAGFRLHDSVSAQGSAAAAFNGNQLLVVWVERTGNPVVGSLYATVVSPAAPLPARVLHIADGVASDDVLGGADQPAAAWNGSEWVVVWQDNAHELAGMRLGRGGDPIDALPIRLTSPPRSPYVADRAPRIAWDGSEYLVVWQQHRWYFPLIGIGEVPPTPAGDIAAQRYTRELVPDGLPVSVAIGAGDLANNPFDADSPDVAFSNGVWLVAWTAIDWSGVFGAPVAPRYARINASGVRVDPLNGLPMVAADSRPMHVAAAADGWLVGTGRTFTIIAADGSATPAPFASPDLIEAFALRGSLPAIAYSVTTDDTRAFIHVVAERRRAAR